MKLLMAMPWKGNVRELDNMLERAMILGNGEWVTVADLPRGIEPNTVLMASLSDNLKEAVLAYEKSHIERVLKRMDGDKKETAEALGMSLSSLYRKLEDLTIGSEEGRNRSS
jgi:DNA-binding NtrC family response regulator